MANKLHLSHVKTSVKDKVPSASTITYGEIAINYNYESPALYIKDNQDNIVKFISEPYFNEIVGTGVTENDGSTITPISEIIQEDERVISAAINELRDTKADKDEVFEAISDITIEVDSELDSASTNPVENRAITTVILENELITARALNNLNANKASKTDLINAINNLAEDIAVTGVTTYGSGNVVTGVTLEDKNLVVAYGTVQGGGGEQVVTGVTISGSGNAITGATFTNKLLTLSKGNVVTGITMNSAAKSVSNGVVDLGTVITAQTQLSTGATQGSGNVVTSLAVNNHQITLTKGITIPAWATASTKPSYTASEVGALASNATLDNVSDGTTRKLSNYLSGATMNGAAKSVTNGVVDLGTVVTAQTQLSTGATQGSGNVVTSLAVSNHQITLTKGITIPAWATASTKPSYTASEVGAPANTEFTGHTATTIASRTSSQMHLPTVSATDNGKVLQVSNGAWGLVSPATIYTGSNAPNQNLGADGDIYLQTS